jgi:hypothetical protein
LARRGAGFGCCGDQLTTVRRCAAQARDFRAFDGANARLTRVQRLPILAADTWRRAPEIAIFFILKYSFVGQDCDPSGI